MAKRKIVNPKAPSQIYNKSINGTNKINNTKKEYNFFIICQSGIIRFLFITPLRRKAHFEVCFENKYIMMFPKVIDLIQSSHSNLRIGNIRNRYSYSSTEFQYDASTEILSMSITDLDKYGDHSITYRISWSLSEYANLLSIMTKCSDPEITLRNQHSQSSDKNAIEMTPVLKCKKCKKIKPTKSFLSGYTECKVCSHPRKYGPDPKMIGIYPCSECYVADQFVITVKKVDHLKHLCYSCYKKMNPGADNNIFIVDKFTLVGVYDQMID